MYTNTQTHSNTNETKAGKNLMTITVFISLTGHVHIYNYQPSLSILYSFWPKQASQLVMVLYLIVR